MRNRKTDEKIVYALFVGGIFGAMASILYAPKKGKEIRNAIRQRADEVTSNISHAVVALTEELESKFDSVGDEIASKTAAALEKGNVTAIEAVKVLEKKLKKLRKRMTKGNEKISKKTSAKMKNTKDAVKS